MNGYDKVDQFQTSALRYQINHLGYGLGMLQCMYTPSFHGYLSQAQRNLIELYLDRRIWGYWLWESAWGHLNLTDPDPAAKDNIMLTGWFGIQPLSVRAKLGLSDLQSLRDDVAQDLRSRVRHQVHSERARSMAQESRYRVHRLQRQCDWAALFADRNSSPIPGGRRRLRG